MSNMYVESKNIYVRQQMILTQALVVKKGGLGLIGYYQNGDHASFDNAYFEIVISDGEDGIEDFKSIAFYSHYRNRLTGEYTSTRLNDLTGIGVHEDLLKEFDELNAEFRKNPSYAEECISEMKFHPLIEDLLNLNHPDYTDMPYRSSLDSAIDDLVNSDYYEETFGDDAPDQSLFEDEGWLEDQLLEMMVSELNEELSVSEC